MAELLIVVAIVIVLMMVAFIAVPSYQRSSTRLEYDGIAKEIFIAAQNHLTTAQSQGYLQMDSDSDDWSKQLGSLDTSSAEKVGDERYFLFNAVDTYASSPLESESLLDLMLPFGAIDETVRAGGTYIIRYQPSSGRVLDVFYSLPGRSSLLTVNGLRLVADHYNELMANCRGDEHREQRQNFHGGVVGWYGGADGLPVGKHLNDPEIIVHNEDTLWVEVIDKNTGEGSLKLIITGAVSGAQKSFELRSSTDSRVNGLHVTLDDITKKNFHFAELTADDDINKHFLPGEDIIIEAVAYNNTALTNIAYSGKKTTNSLFAEIEEKTAEDKTTHTAKISSFRHLENLDSNISKLDDYDTGNKLNVVKAEQTVDLSWTGFRSKVEERNIVPLSSDTVANGCYLPVSPRHYDSAAAAAYALQYDGQNHKITDVKADYSGDAGLFGTMIAGSSVSNLELIDFDIKGTTSAGALIGTARGTTITNVLAHHTEKNEAYKTDVIKASGGDAGGLIGSAVNCTVSRSAAALTVNGSANAGGLIGKASDTGVTESYAGGHTNKAKYYTDSGETIKAIYNVTGGATAGGLIGNMTGGSATNCYSTCSATGGTVGGFVGESTGSIRNSYCTGLVKGIETEKVTKDGKTTIMPKDGAFAYSVATVTDCRYFEIINERQDSTKGYTYLTALGRNQANAGITPIDENMTNYDAFCGAPGTWDPAKPYDQELVTIYKNSFNLRTVDQIGKTPKAKSSGTDFVTTHYGDWPAPEEFVFNAG